MYIPHNRVYIGLKQSTRAILNNEVEKVILASDADEHLAQQITDLCHENHVEISHGDTRTALGKTYGVSVGAAVVAVLK